MGFPKLVIKSHNIDDFSVFDFGISEKNGLVPYIWGGSFVALPNGKFGVVFEDLSNGVYKWFVKLKNTTDIIRQGTEFVGDLLQPYEKTFYGLSVITIPRTEHLKAKISSIIIRDVNKQVLNNNPELTDDETVIIYLSEPQTVTVRIS